MCIICNCSEDGIDFVSAFGHASRGMKDAADAMLKCSKTATDAAVRARYDSMHKKMARLLREWNAIEHERETGDGGQHAA